MKITDIETLFDKATRAKKLSDEIQTLKDARGNLADNCPFELSVLNCDAIDSGRRTLGTQSWSDTRDADQMWLARNAED